MKIVYMFFIMLIHQSHSHVLSPPLRSASELRR